MDFGFEGKVALVTGASSGLGLAAAKTIFAEGARIAICSSDRARVTDAAESISKSAEEVLPVVCDLTKPDQIDKMVTAVHDHFGRIDIVLTNCGGPPLGQHDSVGEEEWKLGYDLTFMSAIRLIQKVVPGMKEREFGRIILSTSISAKQPIENLLLSNTYRAGLLGYAKTISRELAPYGITVNSVLPGYTRTERLNYLAGGLAEKSGRSAEDIFGDWEDKIPVGRIGLPEEYGAVVAFLASTQAAFVTGTAIPIDGGQASCIP